MPPSPPRVLSVAGSDSGGAAGIQADLKAIARSGGHGMTAITAITAQNTVTVDAIVATPPGVIAAQIGAVVSDIGVDAVKVGMLGSAETIEEVAEALGRLDGVPIVVDPVMLAESGARLLPDDAVSALVERILPLAAVATPNLPEARVLAGVAPSDLPRGDAPDDGPTPVADTVAPEDLARAVLALGPAAVVVTGGHRDEVTDMFAAGDGSVTPIPGERFPGGAAHGSGCTHSSTLATCLAHGLEPLEAARRARRVAGEAVRDGLREIGAGNGPVDALGVVERGAPHA